jgi:hypothetical protein
MAFIFMASISSPRPTSMYIPLTLSASMFVPETAGAGCGCLFGDSTSSSEPVSPPVSSAIVPYLALHPTDPRWPHIVESFEPNTTKEMGFDAGL